MQASDADRERVVRDLTRHCGDGRLTLDELEDRIAEAYAAATTAELDHALRDLPQQPVAIATPPRPPIIPTPGPLPVRTRHHPHQLDARRGGELALRIHLVVYLSVIGLLTAIWFLTTPFSGGYWPIWVAMPWGMAIAIHAGVHKAVWAARDQS